LEQSDAKEVQKESKITILQPAIPSGACIPILEVTCEERNSELHMQLRGQNMKYLNV
jgi:hypothetical protein